MLDGTVSIAARGVTLCGKGAADARGSGKEFAKTISFYSMSDPSLIVTVLFSR